MTQFLFLTSTLISLSFLGEVDSNEQQSLNLNHGKKCYEYVNEGCIIGSNIGEKEENLTVEQCQKWCDDTPECVAIEYGVEYKAPESKWKYNAKDCRLQNSIEKNNCDGKQYNLDLYVVVSCRAYQCIEEATDIPGPDEIFGAAKSVEKNVAACLEKCKTTIGCKYWTFVKYNGGGENGDCYPKSDYFGKGGRKQADLHWSGARDCHVCDLPKVVGAGSANESRWYSNNGTCTQFVYGGSSGNANNFSSEDACKQRCPGTCDPNTYKQSPEDSCQTCECNHAGCYLRSSFRKRREVSDLGEDDFDNYAAGINMLESNDYWATYEVTHRRDSSLYHGRDTNFLHWHRRFLYDMETELIKQTRNCSIAIPYWAADLEQLGEFGVQVRTDKYFGENGRNTTLGKNCVRGKHFNWSQKTGQSHLYQRKGCITRSWNTRSASSVAVNVIADRLGEKKIYSEWRNQLETFHNHVHGLVGGHMSNAAVSSYDPIFWSHHANVDRMWDDKQRTKPAWKNLFTSSIPPYFNLAGLNHNSNASPSEVIILNVTHVFDLTQMRVIEEDGEPFWPVKYEIPVQKGAAFNKSRIDRSMINVKLMIEIERIEELGNIFAASMASSTNNNNANRENPGTVEPRESRNWEEKINEEIERIENRYKP